MSLIARVSRSYPYEWHELNETALETLAYVARRRGAGKAECRSSKLMGRGDTPEEQSFNQNWIGAIGEYWFAKLHGGFFDPVVKRYGDRHEPDVYVGKVGYAVKTVDYMGPTPMMMIDGMEQIEKCDRIALCAFDYPNKRVSFVATCSKQEFIDRYVMKTFKHGPTMCVVYGG